jgi:hypothetical protein
LSISLFIEFTISLIQNRGPSLSDRGQIALKNAIHAAASALESNVDHLNELDSGCGDGDCGSTLNRFADGTLISQSKLPFEIFVSILKYFQLYARWI